MKYTIEATIPVVQYGNIKPMIEVDSIESEDEAVDTIKRLWDRFGESPIKDKTGGGVKLTTFTGEEVIFNEDNHTYTDLVGNVLLSGSRYADKFSPKFDMAMMLPKTSKSWEVPEDVIKDMWKSSGDISTGYGSAIHTALELYHKYHAYGEQIQKKKELDHNYVLPKNKYLKDIVLSFVEKFSLNGLPEVLVSDVANKMAGSIDRLEIVDEAKKIARIGDYKTNYDMDAKKILKYQKQLSFYAHILQNKGWTVQGLDLYYLDQDDGWVKTELEVLPLEE